MKLEYCRIEASKHDKDSFLAVIPETFGDSYNLGTMELSHPYGFASRPVDKDAEGGACGAFYSTEGAQGYCWLANDGRIQSKLPEVLEGESFQYGVTGNFVRCHQDGRISLFTTDDATVNGRTVAFTIGPKGLLFSYPYGKLTIDETGFHYLHNSGARIDAGAIGGLPAPLDVVSSYASIGASAVRLNGAAVSLGTSTGAPQPVALAVTTLSLFGALSSVLTALATPGAFISASPGSPCAVGPELAAAIASAATAITGAATTLPSLATVST
jgi:hypothetical protein